MQYRTLIGIAVSVILVAILGMFVWFYFFSDASPRNGGDGDSVFDVLFPFGGGGGGDDTPRQPDEPGQTDGPQPAPIFRAVSSQPVVAGVGFIASSTERIRYIERATGHVYEAMATSTSEERISNTTIPRLQRGAFTRDGERLVVQYLDAGTGAITTFSGAVAGGKTAGIFLQSNIRDFAIDPSGGRILTLTDEGGANVIARDLDGGDPVLLFSSALGGWLLDWEAQNTILLSQSPSGAAPGPVLHIDLPGGAMGSETLPRFGLTGTLSPSGAYTLISFTDGASMGLAVIDRADGSIRNLPVNTLTEKCVWSRSDEAIVYCAVPDTFPNGTYPDTWYRGDVHFTDTIWRIDVSRGVAQFVFAPEEEAGVSIDAIELTLTPDDSHLLFIDKNDLLLWSLDVKRALQQ